MTLSAPLRAALETLRHSERQRAAALRERVLAHLAEVRAASARSAFVDRECAEQVAAQCLALLDGWDALGEESRAWVQAGCLYFCQSEDGEDDFASIVGFDDDAEVLAFVLDRVGRADLMEP